MKEIIYIVESRNTKTNDFISDSGFARYKNEKEYLNKLVNNKKYYKEEDYHDLIEEKIKKEIEL